MRDSIGARKILRHNLKADKLETESCPVSGRSLLRRGDGAPVPLGDGHRAPVRNPDTPESGGSGLGFARLRFGFGGQRRGFARQRFSLRNPNRCPPTPGFAFRRQGASLANPIFCLRNPRASLAQAPRTPRQAGPRVPILAPKGPRVGNSGREAGKWVRWAGAWLWNPWSCPRNPLATGPMAFLRGRRHGSSLSRAFRSPRTPGA